MNLLSRQLWSAKSLKKIIQWYKHFLECQAAYTVTNDITRRVKVKHGTAQGGILRPLIWNLMFESFLKLFEKGPISVVGFADDAALVAKGISASVIRDIMNKAKVHFRLGVQKFTFDLGLKSSSLTWGSKVHFRLGVQKFIFNLGFKSSFLTWGSNVWSSNLQRSKVQGSKVHFYLRVQKSGVQSSRVQKFITHFGFKCPVVKSYMFKSPKFKSLQLKSSFLARGSNVWVQS